MARVKKDIADMHKSPFPVALRELMSAKPVTTQEKLAEITGKTRQTVSQYVNGISEPGYDTLVKIADYFDVPIDYLLGRTKDPSPIRSSVDDLGLSAKAVEWLKKSKQEEISGNLSMLFEDRDFQYLVTTFIDYSFVFEAETLVNRIYSKHFPDGSELKDSDSENADRKYQEELDRILNTSVGRFRQALCLVKEYEDLMYTNSSDKLFGSLGDQDQCILSLSDLYEHRVSKGTYQLLKEIRAQIINDDIKRAFSMAEAEWDIESRKGKINGND